jgi:flagellar basal body-associated protein FliL
VRAKKFRDQKINDSGKKSIFFLSFFLSFLFFSTIFIYLFFCSLQDGPTSEVEAKMSMSTSQTLDSLNELQVNKTGTPSMVSR